MQNDGQDLIPVTLDFETYYDKDYSLKKVSTLEYIRSPKFKVHGAAIKIGGQPARWITGTKLKDAFEAVEWGEALCITHNALFDLTILYEKYGISPAQRVDTLGLCRALLPHSMNFDLGTVSRVLGLGEKGDELALSKGVEVLSPEIEEKIAGYARQDVELTYKLFKMLWPELPEDERRTMNQVLRMSTQGRLLMDHQTAMEAVEEIKAERQQHLEKTRVKASVLRSREAFAELLKSKGIEPPTKISPATGKRTWAFSKQDPEFVALRSDPVAGPLVEARLAWASNNAIKRLERLIRITSLPPRTLPVMLNYHGAHTGRFSGGGQINMQNLDSRGARGKLRKSLFAPRGHKLLIYDLSGIELRLNLWFCGQHDILRAMAEGEDPYRIEANRQTGRPVEEISKDSIERKLGKALVLGAGYGMSAERFRLFCAAGPFGMEPIKLTEAKAAQAIAQFRCNNSMISRTWAWLQNVALPLMTCRDKAIEHNPVVFEYEAIRLPNGLRLLYPDLRLDEETNSWTYGLGDRRSKLFGGKLLENIIQALAGVLIKKQMLEIEAQCPGCEVVLQVHDEVVVMAPDDRVDECKAVIEEVMTTTPPWAEGLPLDVEGAVSERYDK